MAIVHPADLAQNANRFPPMKLLALSIAAALLCHAPLIYAETVAVANVAEFRAAVAAAKPGTRIVMTAGKYGGGHHFAGLRGEPGKPIVIAAADAANPPVFSDSAAGMHLAKPAYVELHDLSFSKLSANGLNIDDGGTGDGAGAHHVVLKGLRVADVGTRGNHDGIKLSGLSDFQISGCTVERWGTGGGSAIDMVGCHRGVIEGNVFRHQDAPGCSGVQAKGGSSEVAILGNRFEDAGGRAVNAGGSTGLEYFRPRLKAGGGYAEAHKIRIEGNHFKGGLTSIAFAGADGVSVRWNTIEHPGRWAFRILQETKEAGFVPCRNVEIADNVIVFTSGKWSENGINIGAGTAPETFKFARNWWYCQDRPERSRPKLPTEESGGVYGREPAGAAGKAGASGWRK
jgi:hypothetical protein